MIDYERANNYDHGREGLKKALLKGQTHKQLLKVNFSKNPAEKTQNFHIITKHTNCPISKTKGPIENQMIVGKL